MHLIEDYVIYSAENTYYKFHLLYREKIKITVAQYCELLFGNFNTELVKRIDCSNSFGLKNIYSAFYQSPDLLIFSKNGKLVEKKANFFDGFTPYEIAISASEKEVWVATGARQVVFCKEIESKIIKYATGQPYQETNEMSFPESIVIYDNHLFISEMGNKRISKINLDNYQTGIYREFEEPVWEYFVNNKYKIVRLDSGIYSMNHSGLSRLEL